MKRVAVFSITVGVIVVLAMVLARSSRSPAEIVRLSESLVVSRIHTYYQSPTLANLAAVRDVIANHQRAIQRADLPREAREKLEWNLDEQKMIVRGIAHDYNLKF